MSPSNSLLVKKSFAHVAFTFTKIAYIRKQNEMGVYRWVLEQIIKNNNNLGAEAERLASVFLINKNERCTMSQIPPMIGLE